MRARRCRTTRVTTAPECSLACEEKPPARIRCDNRRILSSAIRMIIDTGGGTAVEPFLSVGAVTGGARAMAAARAAGLWALWVFPVVCVCPVALSARPRSSLSPSPRAPLSPNWCASLPCGVACRLGRAGVPSVGGALWGLWRRGVAAVFRGRAGVFPALCGWGVACPPFPSYMACVTAASVFCAAARSIYFCVVSRCSCPSIRLIVLTLTS